MFRLPMLGSSKGCLDLGGKQMGKTEYLLGAALGLVIVGSLAMAIYTSGNPSAPGDGLNHFKCYSCGKEFTVDPMTDPTLNRESPDYRPPDPYGPPSRICPSCKNKDAYPMTYCPKCKKYFLPDKRTWDPMHPPEVKIVCPICGTDPWAKDHK